jgi:membrane protein DedA with SNARE-associated domain
LQLKNGFSKKGEKPFLQRAQIFPSLFLIFMGSMDCLTTVIGTLYYDTRELNPVLAGLVSSNLPAFVTVKLTATVAVGLIFILAQKTLMRTPNKNSASFKIALQILRIAYFSIILFLAIVVTNNLLVLINSLL